MFERFTDRARRVLVEAQQEAVEARHGFIGTEHVLLGLAREGGGLAHQILASHGLTLEVLRPEVASAVAEFVADDLGIDEATALAAIGIDFERVRASIEASFGEGSLSAHLTRPPFTPKSKHALEQSFRESLFLRHNFIGTEHLLVGFVAEDEGLARRVVANLGVDPDELIDEVRRAAAPAYFRVSDLYEAIREFELRNTPAEDDATRSALLRLSQGRVDAMHREYESITAATVALASELEELLRVAESSVATEPR
jgi:ATP-dependent Clp protease ATP-binding subunit ClpC